MTKSVSELIRETGAAGGVLIYIRSARGYAVPGAKLTTASDLLGLKLEAVQAGEPVVATGPATDEAFADFVIDVDGEQPQLVKGAVIPPARGVAPELG